ncbi:MAG: RNA methyltransferase [Alphaproteobacteria bacterium]|nr:RNA methyltransferase [Alphaproteobacteria bacterium]
MRQRPQPRRPPRRPAPVPAGEAPDEFKVSGLRAVEALFRRDPDAIRRLYLDRAAAPAAGAICRYLAERRRAYAVKDDAELARIAGTLHHGGIVAVIAARVPRLPGRGEIDAWATARQPVLVLDGVSNPHNLGAIVRTAAFLGIEQVVLSERPEQALPSPAAYRVAEGGFEHVALWRPPAVAAFLRELGRFHRILAASPRGTSLAGLKRDQRPVALVLGNEETGLSPAVEKLAAERIAIAGADGVESLNVSVAAGILMYELLRR